MKTRVVHTAVAAFGMVICAAVGAVAPTLWQDTGGRSFRSEATTMADRIMILAVALRRGLRWPAADFFLGLLPVEVITLSVIAYFSGFTGFDVFDSFNMSWLVFMNTFIGLPWLFGLATGSVWLGVSRNRAPNAA